MTSHGPTRWEELFARWPPLDPNRKGFDPDPELFSYKYLYQDLGALWGRQKATCLRIRPNSSSSSSRSIGHEIQAQLRFHWNRDLEYPLHGIPRQLGQRLANMSTIMYISILSGEEPASNDMFRAVFASWAERALLLDKPEEAGNYPYDFAAASMLVHSANEPRSESTGDCATPSALVPIHQVMVNRVKSLHGEMYARMDRGMIYDFFVPRSLESTFILANGRNWGQFKSGNPGTAATQRINVTLVGRSSVLLEELPEEMSAGFEEVSGLSSGAEKWVQKVVDLKTAIAIVMSIDDIGFNRKEPESIE